MTFADLDPTALDALELAARVAYFSGFAQGIRPRPYMDLDEWSERHVVLTSGEGHEFGPYRVSRVPYVRDLMKCLSLSSPTQRHCVVKAAQMGYTQVVKCWVGYLIDLAPQQILFYLPSLHVAKQTKRQRIDPLIDETEVLRGRVAPSGSRSRGNTALDVSFAGGALSMRGANSAAAFRNISAGIIVADDLDGWVGEVGKEGSPLLLLRKRASTFPGMKELLISTPTLSGLSAIDREWELSDQRRWFLPCPHCGEYRVLTWSGFMHHTAKEGPGHHFMEWPTGDPDRAYMRCGACKGIVEEREKPVLYERAEWRPQNPAGSFPGWHLPAMCAPLGWHGWGKMAREWEETRGNPFALKGFVNTSLAETYEERAYGGKPAVVLSRLEAYDAEVPDGVGVLTAGIDTQDDRLVVAVKGYGAGEESWLIAYLELAGDPAQPEVWRDLDEYLMRAFQHASGRYLHIECAAIDAMGHKTDHVYRYVRHHARRYVSGRRPDGLEIWPRGRTRLQRVVAVRGTDMRGSKELVGLPSRNNQYKLPVFPVNDDAAKELVYGRLAISLRDGERGRPGYMHFPAHVDREYADGLMSERGHYKYVKGKGTVRVWEQTHPRNEPLDVEKYCLVALHVLDGGRGSVIGTLGKRAAFFSSRDGVPAPPAATASAAATPPKAEGSASRPSPAHTATAPPRRSSTSPAPRRKGWIRNW